MNPKFLIRPSDLSIEIKLLKIRYKQINNIILTSYFNRVFHSFLRKINIKKERSISKIFINDTDAPATIEIGIIENKIKKYFSIKSDFTSLFVHMLQLIWVLLAF